MEMEDKKRFCPILDVDGVISGGKQFDLDITLPDSKVKKYQQSLNKKDFYVIIFIYYYIINYR